MLRRQHGPEIQGAIVCDRWREMPAKKVEEGDMGRPHLRRQCRLEGQRRGGALLPREGQSWRVTARGRTPASKNEAVAARAGAEAGVGAAGCKLSDTAGARRAKPAVRLAVRMTLWTLKVMRRAARQMGRRQLT